MRSTTWVQYTSTSSAPWTLVEGNDKRFARIKVLETYCNSLAGQLGAEIEKPKIAKVS